MKCLAIPERRRIIKKCTSCPFIDRVHVFPNGMTTQKYCRKKHRKIPDNEMK